MSLITRPTKEPVTLKETKLACDIEHDDDDQLITRLISAAREYSENYTQSSLVRQQHRQYFHYQFCDEMPLCFGPVQSIEQIQYIDGDGVTQTLSTSPTIYELDPEEDKVRRAYGASWPSTRYQKNAVWIDYWAGYFNPNESPIKLTDEVPDGIKSAIMMMVRDLYDNPAKQGVMKLYQNPAYDALIGPYRAYM